MYVKKWRQCKTHRFDRRLAMRFTVRRHAETVEKWGEVVAFLTHELVKADTSVIFSYKKMMLKIDIEVLPFDTYALTC